MADQVRSVLSRDSIKSALGLTVAIGATALVSGAASVPAAIARGWMGKKAVDVGADVLAKTLVK